MSTAATALPSAEPACFRSAMEAWFWTLACLEARRTGAQRRPTGTPSRPAGPEDVLCCLDRLYKAGTIRPAHAHVLRRWGDRRHAPDARSPLSDRTLWCEAMAALEGGLRKRGLVAASEIGK